MPTRTDVPLPDGWQPEPPTSEGEQPSWTRPNPGPARDPNLADHPDSQTPSGQPMREAAPIANPDFPDRGERRTPFDR